MDNNIIDFESAKSKVELKKLEKDNNKTLTKTALTCDYHEYLLMDYMCNLVKSSKEIANDPIEREKFKKLLRTK